MKFKLAVIGLILCQTVAAQEGTSTTQLQPQAEESKYNLGMVGLQIPLGASVMYQRRIGDQFAVGPFGSYTRWTSSDDKDGTTILRDVRWDINRYGLEARYKLSSFDESGFYLAGAYQRLDIRGQGTGTLAVSGRDVTIKSNRTSKNGYYAKAGWMARMAHGMRLDFNALWGTGNELTWIESTDGTLTLTKVEAGLGLGANFGVMF